MGDDIELSFATIGGVQKRLEHGETADIIMGTASVIAQMERVGVLVPGSRAELGRTLTGICVHAAAPMPDISTPESFKQTMLKARSVAYTNRRRAARRGFFSPACSNGSASPPRSATKHSFAATATK
jgi:molybdate transport system substrate-binding protein